MPRFASRKGHGFPTARPVPTPRTCPRLEVLEDRTLLTNAIVAENLLPGSPASEWDVPGAGSLNIVGFATDISVDQGQTVEFKVDTDASDYRLDIYRMGYYGGMGARKVATVQPFAAPDVQPPPLTDPATGLVDCGNWSVSASWAVPADATSGIYFAKLVREDGTPGASHIYFVVRDDDGHSDLLFQTSDTTWQAYNNYGGTSLYEGGPGTNPGRAYAVSYNRPFVTRQNLPHDFLFNAEYPMVRWLEANGYDVSYSTGVDTDRRGAELLEHQVFMTVGQDEYWSGGQRAAIEAARDQGVNMAFFAGGDAAVKTRWEASIDGSGTPYRTLVCYKETRANAKIDPLPDVWTGNWRDPRFSPPADGGRPENAVTGSLVTVNFPFAAPIQVPEEDGKMRFWRNTSVASLEPGQVALTTGGALGHEFNEDIDNGFRPAGLMHLSSTTAWVSGHMIDYGNTFVPGLATHHLTMYRAPSGALVFGAGTVQWSWGLDPVHDRPTDAVTPDSRMEQATVNLFADMGVQPGSLKPSLIPATASTDTTPAVSVITSAIPTTLQTGTPFTIYGTATDVGGRVGAVEVSLDNGLTWHPALGRGNWYYTWTPTTAGPAVVTTRASDDSGNVGDASVGISATVLASQTTAPGISDVQVTVLSTDSVLITWATDEPATSAVEYGTSPDTLSINAFDGALTQSHSITLTGLGANTTYYYRVRSIDANNNVSISPPPAGQPATFFTSTVHTSSAAAFAAGTTGTTTYISETAGGEVTLAPTVGAEFSGTALPADWITIPAGSSLATVSGGLLTVNGVRAGALALRGPGQSLQARATFSGDFYQHVGFGTDFTAPPAAVFTTTNNGTNLRAQTSVGSTILETVIPGNWFNTAHVYRVDWTSSDVTYFIDDTQVASHALALTASMRPLVADDNTNGPSQLTVDWLRVSPYTSSGSYLSQVFDAGPSVTWTTASWTGSTPAGTGLTFQVRTGNTPTPDASWSNFVTVPAPGDPVGTSARYLQYRADMTTSDPEVSPALYDVSFRTGNTIDVAFASPASSGSESTTSVLLPVTLSAASAQTVTVTYSVTGGTATGGGVDYTLAAGSLTFTPGQTTQNIPLAIVNDTLDELDETLTVTLSSPTNASLGANTSHTYTILDNDSPAVSFTTAASQGSEKSLAVTLNVTLSQAHTSAVAVSYAATGGTATGGGVDYLLPPGTLTFAPGETSKTIPLNVVFDRNVEADETVIVTLSSPTGGAVLGANPTHTYTIQEGGLSAGTASLQYLSTAAGGTVTGSVGGSVTFTDSDLLRLIVNTSGSYEYLLYFDGSDVGLTTSSEGLDAFALLADGSFLVSFDGSYSVPGASGTLTGAGEDVLRFIPTSLGANTAGTWVLYFDGSDVGLSGSSENVDAIAVLPDGRLILSTTGNPAVTGVSGAADEDLLAFTPTSLGATTAGSWALYFDGSDVGLSTSSSEDIDALYLSPNGAGLPTLYFSTAGNFSVTGTSGADEDVFQFNPTSLGTTTAGTFTAALALDGSRYGLASFNLNAIWIVPPPGQSAPASGSRLAAQPDDMMAAEIDGARSTVPGQAAPFRLSVDGGKPSSSYTYFIDWDGDGSYDEKVTGPSTLEIDHVFHQAGRYTVSAAARGGDGRLSAVGQVPVTVSNADLQFDPLDPDRAVLVVGATDGDDVIIIGNPTPRGLTIWLNGVALDLPTTAVTGPIVVFGLDGDDQIYVRPNVTHTVVLHGGQGNDYISSKGAGPAILIGGAGSDWLDGGRNDLLIGAAGNDRLSGSSPLQFQDVPDTDVFLAALRAILRGRTDDQDALRWFYSRYF